MSADAIFFQLLLSWGIWPLRSCFRRLRHKRTIKPITISAPRILPTAPPINPPVLPESLSELFAAEEGLGPMSIEAVTVTTELICDEEVLAVLTMFVVMLVAIFELSEIFTEAAEDSEDETVALVEDVLLDAVVELVELDDAGSVAATVGIVTVLLSSSRSSSGQVPVVHGSVEQHPWKFPAVHTYHSFLFVQKFA